MEKGSVSVADTRLCNLCREFMKRKRLKLLDTVNDGHL